MIFGMPAFQNYYMIHDNERSRLGIAPYGGKKTKLNESDSSVVGMIQEGKVGGPPWWATFIVVSAVLGGSLAFFIVYFVGFLGEKFPDSQWIQAEIATAYWFGNVLLFALIRYLMSGI